MTTIRTAFLAATAALAVTSTPALSQAGVDYGERYGEIAYEDEYGNVLETGDYRGTWDGEWESLDTYRGTWDGIYTDIDGYTMDASFEGVWVDDSRFLSDDGRMIYRDGEHGWYEDAYSSADGRPLIRRDIAGRSAYQSHAPRVAYSAAERAEWLEQCRALRDEGGRYAGYQDEYYDDRYYRDDDHPGGGMVGSVLGAVAGGVAGNRIAGRGDRLAGTLIGLGLGGLAGAVSGSVIDGLGDGDDEYYEGDYHEDELYFEDDYGFGYCEAYLLNYERGHPLPTQTASIAYAPVMVAAPQPAPAIHRAMPARHRIIEERVIVERAEHAPPAPPGVRREVVQPVPSKRQPLR